MSAAVELVLTRRHSVFFFLLKVYQRKASRSDTVASNSFQNPSEASLLEKMKDADERFLSQVARGSWDSGSKHSRLAG